MNDSTPERIDATVAAAAAAADEFASTDAPTRAALLRDLAEGLEAARDSLVAMADAEASLGVARLNGELDRTAFQLRGFAERASAAFDVIDEAAVPGTPPQGRPRLTRVRVPLGPVAMFAASNFPFAFSVLGGDTASAFAAGCPVVVKAHPGHPRLSRAVAEIARNVVAQRGLPAGTFGIVEGGAVEVGAQLVQHPDINAVAFTGSFKGGVALQAAANDRPRPIPFYGELGSVNPVVVLPAALEGRAEDLARALAASIAQGCGQFCTSPGIAVLFDAPGRDAFIAALGSALEAQALHPMLTMGMRHNFDTGVARLQACSGVRTLLASPRAAEPTAAAPRPFLATVDQASFVAQPALGEEVFGPACLLVTVASVHGAEAVLRAIGGSLTATLWGAEGDSADTRRLVRAAARVAGRVLFEGVPTGVAIGEAQQHGGPWPASTQPMTTSVGYAAIERFLRPVALQSAPDWLVGLMGRPS